MMRQAVLVIALVFLPLATACAPRERVVAAETYDGDARARIEVEPAPSVETHPTVIEDDDDPGERGFFGILTDVVTLPFRAVGGLLDAIF